MLHRPLALLWMLALAPLPAAAAEGATSPDVVGTVAGAVVTAGDLQARTSPRERAEDASYAAQVARLTRTHERALQAIREEELQRLVDEKLVATEAARQKLTPEALLARIERPQPSKSDIYSFYEQRREQISAPFEVVSDNIRDHLASDAYNANVREFYEGLRRKYPNASHLEPRREAVPGHGPARGPDSAPVTIVEFADFQCPYCVRVAPVLQRLQDEHRSDVRLEFRQLPLTTLHPEAQRAAEAAVCADEQQRFWAFHDAVFAAAGQFDGGALIDIAKRAGAEPQSYRECLTSGRGAEGVKADVAVADDLVLAGTPALFVNGRLIAGAPSYEALAAIVDDELRRAHAAPQAQP
jgi:protein-disulfide isomerase